MDGPLLEARIFGNLLEKSAFLASKLGNGPLIELLRYVYCKSVRNYMFLLYFMYLDNLKTLGHRDS